MATVSFQNIEKSFGSTKVIQGISFDIKEGEFMVLVGPSGCGKSTLLRMLAGLEEITGGTIAIDDKVVNDVESKDRDIAMVFQSYALYPHMTVGENMAFSLKLRKADPKMMAERVAHASKILNLDPYLQRFPRELSGGQRQRVAMGRAIVRDPKVFLFDEPLSNLDAKLRVAMRAEIKALHQRLKTTTVYVTHDQVEAMTMADRIVVMHDGRIEQIGSPLSLYDHPDNLFVAQFIGSPAMNVMNGKVARANGASYVEVAGGVRWPLPSTQATEGQAVAYGIRPGDLRLAGADAADTVAAEIVVVEPTGAETELLIQAGEAQLILVTHGRPNVNPGDRIGLAIDPAKVHVFDEASGARKSWSVPNTPILMAKKTTKTKRKLRSQVWFDSHDRDALVHRSWMKNQGIPHDQFDGRPVIGICNTWSQATPCNGHFRELAQHIRDGVLDAGGFPIEFPVMSLGETLMRPTTMLFRNQAAMDVEESIRANPFDGVVLMMGCDKTTPSLLMGAASCDLPTIGISGGPMLNGKFRGEDIGSGTHVWKFTEMLKTGEMKLSDMEEVESCMSRSAGHCMTMGTASTMASMVEALGMGLPTNAAIPAVDSRRKVLARMAGRRIVEMVHEDLRMSQILTRDAFENAIMVNGAIGGSTNAVVHLLAIAGRMGVKLSLDDWDRLGRDMPCLVDLMPSGRFLMEDFYYAGGLPVVIREIGKFLHKKALTVNGRTIWDNVKTAVNYNPEVITPLAKPFKPQGGIAVLRGNLAPKGAVLKPSAATPKLLQHKGRAVVFESIDDLHKRIDDPKLDVDESCVLVLKNCGPKGYPGFPEVGNFALPAKLLKKGITDMIRISDARMSGTAYGTVVLHTSPEAAAGGPLALVENGDVIELDVAKRRLHLHVTDAELAKRRAKWKPAKPHADRGWVKLYCDTVLQADEGVDLDFLVGKSGAKVGRPSH